MDGSLPEVLDEQTRWVWFMRWSRFEDTSPETLRNLYSDPRTLILDDVKKVTKSHKSEWH